MEMVPAILIYSLFLVHPSWEASAGVREEERWVKPRCVGSGGDSSLLQESGMLFWDGLGLGADGSPFSGPWEEKGNQGSWNRWWCR